MRSQPQPTKCGPFEGEPDIDVSGSRNIRVKYLIGRQEIFVERADVPDLIKLLQDSYGL